MTADPHSPHAGKVFVVATPIGNLGDLSPRAREVLASVSLIAAEDTRHTRQLLQSFGIGTALTSLHEHNESEKSSALIERILRGESLALVSDAGTPLISDPGFDLIAAARAQGIEVIAVPGPCAAIAAVSVAGLPTDRFTFEGFLPAKSAARRAQLESLAAESRTLVFYEAPHRLVETLEDMTAIFGVDRRASVSRELTKRFETTYAGALGELLATAKCDENMSRGEIVIVVAGAAPVQREAVALDMQQLLRALLQELPAAQAAKVAAKITGVKRAELYEMAVRMGKGREE
ncbi:MAG TPA: 16S rRNA (cytidine(1402)-2'-O)-methyltransferase [Povalibacter sp.]|uniref:16S rRNA (cytidine(1402)-2'-O)-methyltransferase n=1 Tax=Povalibacter sp. TaxID=1962978 RepID=UPI002BBB67F9|nr:16S rRNA (cytidine(1402)-2'-O)-methyltransferase [Povalibacter sp.]HMN45023.1 16S rRNA (cytidine(1402)-2'-O)-methyltransferase [Povalibacter sp.]